MPLAELARALPFLLLVGILPGFALATLVVPGWRWWLRLAAAPGLSAGLAGVVGLGFHDLHLPFAAATVLPLEALVVVAAGRRLRGGGHGETAGSAGWVVTAAALAGAVSATIVVLGFQSMPVPLPTDAPVHGIVANAIARTHDTLPAIPDPSQSSAWLRPRSGFEAVAALASEIGGPPATAEMLPLTTLAIALLPLGLAALVLEATGSAAIAALAPLLGVGWALPSVAVFFGEYPYIVDATLVAPLIVAILHALRREAAAATLPMVAVATASIWVVHGLEVITVLAVGGPLLVARLAADRLRALPRLALVGAAAVAGALVVTLLTRPPALPGATASPLAGPVVTETSRFAAGIGSLGITDALSAFVHFAFPGVLAVVLFAIGVAAAILQRRFRWLIATHLLLLGGFVDMLATGHLGRLWQLLYPWSGEDRLPAIQYWVIPVLMAVGAVWLVEQLEAPLVRLLGARRPALRLGALALVGTALLLADARHDTNLYGAAVRDIGIVGSADVTVMRQMSERLPRSAVILVDGGDDSGQWVGAIAGNTPLLSGGFLKDHPDDRRLVALQNACADPQTAASVLGGVDAVFVGTRTIGQAKHPWSLPCVASIPGLTLLARATSQGVTAAAFTVSHPTASGSERRKD